MHALKVSAQFAAFVWYREVRSTTASRAEAMRFARDNWVAFLPAAHEGWGKLLIRVAKLRPAGARAGRPHARRAPKRSIREMAKAS
jgi:hypothetical protein